VFPIQLPPLRDREGDVVLLAERFLELLNASHGTSKQLGAEARERIKTHPWRGNVRELKNEIHRAFIMHDRVLDLGGLSAAPELAPAPAPPDAEVGLSLDESERQLILATLAQCGGDKKKAAQILGVSLKTLYNRLNLYAES
jgi:DNA-binding NtrC family response regulator